jgi:hypothetical protein
LRRRARKNAFLPGSTIARRTGICFRLRSDSNLFRHFEARTGISCQVGLERTACAPFHEERRMKFAEAIKFHRKIRGRAGNLKRKNPPEARHSPRPRGAPQCWVGGLRSCQRVSLAVRRGFTNHPVSETPAELSHLLPTRSSTFYFQSLSRAGKFGTGLVCRLQ